LWDELTGGATRYERKVRKAIAKENIWARYFSVLSLTIQFMLKSLLKKVAGREDNK